MAEQLPKHWKTGKPFDWRDCVVVEDQFSEKQRLEIETSLDQLAQIPDAQDTLKATQSPEIIEAWGSVADKLHEVTDNPKDIPLYILNKYTAPENTKIHIINAETHPGGSHFLPSTRTVGINFTQLEHLQMYTPSGETFRPSLQHILYHEIDHGADINMYSQMNAGLEVEQGAIKSTVASSIIEDDTVQKTRNVYIETVRDLIEEVCEPFTISNTNKVMIDNFEEPERKGHEGKLAPLANPNYMAPLMEPPKQSKFFRVATKLFEKFSGQEHQIVTKDEIVRVLNSQMASTDELTPSASEMKQYDSPGVIASSKDSEPPEIMAKTLKRHQKKNPLLPSASEMPQYEYKGIIADCHNIELPPKNIGESPAIKITSGTRKR